MTKLGSQLHPDDQKYVLATYVHRFTGEHKPDWARKEYKPGIPFLVQFKDDADWLANSKFEVNKNGRLNRKIKYCESCPTWPNNSELRA